MLAGHPVRIKAQGNVLLSNHVRYVFQFPICLQIHVYMCMWKREDIADSSSVALHHFWTGDQNSYLSSYMSLNKPS